MIGIQSLKTKMTTYAHPLATKIGLANVGNTCFLNVIIQALRLSPPIGNIFLRKPEAYIVTRKESKKEKMVSAFQTLMRDFWKTAFESGKTPTMIPNGFYQSLLAVIRSSDDDWYRPGQQADAAEALQYIMDSLHDGMYCTVKMNILGRAASSEEESHIKAINSWSTFFSKEYSPIVHNFNGQSQICITCQNCGGLSERYEPWLMIKAPIPGGDKLGGPAPTMKECLNSAFESETIEDYSCDKCKTKSKAVITTKISRLPPIVILTLKRFTNAGQKVRGKIAWDINNLDFEPWMAFKRDPFTDTREHTSYETYAVVEHHGSLHGGHYFMFARQQEQWVQYDDSSVTNVHPDIVVTPDSYIAFLVQSHSKKTQYDDFVSHIENLRVFAAANSGKAPEA